MWNRIINIYLHNNFHIALCAVFFYLGGKPPADRLSRILVIIIFLGSWLYYSAHRIYLSTFLEPGNSPKRYHQLILASPGAKSWGIISLLTFGILTTILIYLSWKIFVYLAFALIITLLYTFGAGQYLRPRLLPFSRLFMVSVVWTSLFLLGSIQAPDSHYLSWTIAAEKLLFIFALTLPCDWRDREFDAKAGKISLATRYSFMINLLIICLLLVSCISLTTLNSWNLYYSVKLGISLSILYFFQFFLSRFLMQKGTEFMYLLFLDGLIMFNGGIHMIYQ